MPHGRKDRAAARCNGSSLCLDVGFVHSSDYNFIGYLGDPPSNSGARHEV